MGVSTTVDYTVPIEDQIIYMARAGFDFVSIGGNIEHSQVENKTAFGKIMDLAERVRLEIKSFHLPFGAVFDPASSVKDIRQKALDQHRHFIELAYAYRILTGIYHPHHYFTDEKERCLERALVSLEYLLKYIPDDYRLAIENLPTSDGSWICDQILNYFDDSRIGFCYDSSHENISGEPFHLIGKHCGSVFTTHLSDNHGRSDEHLIPGAGNIDWFRLREILNGSSLNHLLFEVGTGERLDYPIGEFLGHTYRRARKFFGLNPKKNGNSGDGLR